MLLIQCTSNRQYPSNTMYNRPYTSNTQYPTKSWRKKEKNEGETFILILLKGCIAELHRGVVPKQLNYPILILPILYRSVDHLVNDH